MLAERWEAIEPIATLLLGSVITLIGTWTFARREALLNDIRDARAIRAPLYDEAMNLVDEIVTQTIAFGGATSGNGYRGQPPEKFAARDAIAASAFEAAAQSRLQANKIISRMRAHASEQAANEYLEVLAYFDEYLTQVGVQMESDGIFRAAVHREYTDKIIQANERFALSARKELWGDLRTMRLKNPIRKPTVPFAASVPYSHPRDTSEIGDAEA